MAGLTDAKDQIAGTAREIPARTRDGGGMTPRWYALMTQPRKEWAVDERLREQGYETFFPFHTAVKRISARKWGTTSVKRAYFPRYLFVRVKDDQSLYPVEKTIGAVGLIRFGQEVIEIPAKVIQALAQRIATGTFEPEPKATGPKPGERYRLGEEAGAFYGLVAIIRQVAKGNREVSVWLDLFGGRVEASVAPEMLEERVT